MKKLLIVSLVLAMLGVFTGVTSAAPVPLWWQSAAEIDHGITLIKEVNIAGNTVLVTTSAMFKGFMVAETSTAAEGGTIDQIFLCGTVTTGASVTDVEILLNNFSLVVTDHAKLPITTETQAGDIIGVGTFTDQTNTLTGPAYLTSKATFNEDKTDTITSIIVSAAVAGGYPQNASKSGLFSGTFSTDLKPLTLATGKTSVTCVAGVVTQQ